VVGSVVIAGVGVWYYQKISSPKQDQSEDNPETGLTIITPYVNKSEISSINEAFSNSAGAPWGFVHAGIDFMTKKDLVPFQAVADGKITNSNYKQENNQQGWHYGFCIGHNDYLVCYNFETFSGADAVGPRQAANIFVKDGDEVKQGDIVGNLVHGGSGAHVDFGVIPPGRERSCPEPYFTKEAKASVLRLIHKDHPAWNMCY